MNKRKNVFGKIAYVILFLGLVFIDQFSKYLSIIHLKDSTDIIIIKNILTLQYLENKGAAFGILQNQRYFFIILTCIFVIVFAYVYNKIPSSKKYLPLKIVCIFIIAGTICNFIDRMFRGYVVDFIYIKFINFPIFNIADMYITISGVVLVILFLFVYKDDDLDFISRKKKTEKE